MMLTSNEIIKLSYNQHKLFMSNYSTWLGNSAKDYFDSPPQYFEKGNLGLMILVKSVLSAQHVRTYNAYNALKNDIWDTRNSFRNQVAKIIMQKNFTTTTLEELEKAVIEGVKDWIIKEKPNSLMDESWRNYAKMKQTSYSSFNLDYGGARTIQRANEGNTSCSKPNTINRLLEGAHSISRLLEDYHIDRKE